MAAALLTEKQEDLLRHMLGINRPQLRNPEPYRDYAAVNPGDPQWLELERLGLVKLYSTEGNYHWYRTTPAGREAAFASHRRWRWPRSARRYAKFLDIADLDPDLTFRRFLTDPRYAEARRAC